MSSIKVIFSSFKLLALNLMYILLIISLNILVKDLSILGKTNRGNYWSRYI
jgi:hypothetical protein